MAKHVAINHAFLTLDLLMTFPHTFLPYVLTDFVVILDSFFFSHMVTRAKEHLNIGSSVKSEIKKHIIQGNLVIKKNTDNLIYHFAVIKKCLSDHDCKIHEALLIKKHQP